MNFSFYIAKRYLKSKSGNHIINIVTLLAGLGVTTGTIALFLVLSVFSGIKEYSLQLLDSDTPHFRISPKQGKTFEFTDDIAQVLKDTPRNIRFSKIIEDKVFLKHNNQEEIARIKGVDTSYTLINELNLITGNWLAHENANSCIISYPLAQNLEVSVYTDLLQIYVPKPGKGYINNPNKAFNAIQPQIVGVIASKNQSQQSTVFVPLILAQQLLNHNKDKISYIDVDLVSDINDIDKTLDYFKTSLNEFYIKRSNEINSSFFKILNSEKLIAYLVSLLVVIMVLSNTSGTIIMIIVDKKSNIKTLLNIGTPIHKIRSIFTIYGVLLNITGMLLGIIIAVLIIQLQQRFNLLMITPTIAYPIKFEWSNVMVTIATIFIFGSLASLVASQRISKKFIK